MQLEPPPLGVQVVPVITESVPWVGPLPPTMPKAKNALSASEADRVMVFAVFSRTPTDCVDAVGVALANRVAVAELSVVLASKASAVTLAVFVKVPDDVGVAAMVTVADEPFATIPKLHVKGLLPLHDP